MRGRSPCTRRSGTILVTGDYKFDQTPVDGRPADIARLAELGRRALLCLCGDSTNADRPGVAPSESSVGPALLEMFSPLRGPDHRHLLRLQRPPRPAGDRRRRALDRKVALVGRSMRKNFNIASNLGIANAPTGC